MASQSFPVLDFTTDTENPVDKTDVTGSTDDFGMYVVRLLQADAPEATDETGSPSHVVSLEVGSLLGNTTHSAHAASDGLTNLPTFSVQDSSADSSGDSSLGLAGLAQAALDNSLIFVGSDGFAKGGPGGGGGGGTGGGTTPAPYTSGGTSSPYGPSPYNIEIVFKGSWTTALYNDFTKAADLLSSYINADVQDVLYRGKIIDDLSITAELTNIDGVGGILGQSGPTAIRTGSYLPAAGSMQFDIADATTFEGLHLFDDIVLHEMMHTLGFGTIWSYKNLLTGAGTANPLFTGSLAKDAYQTLFSVTGAAGVPVEDGGGSGTRDSHWDEETFKKELMTGYIGDGNDMHDYLSYMSVASLGDLGYTLNSSLNAIDFKSPDWIV